MTFPQICFSFVLWPRVIVFDLLEEEDDDAAVAADAPAFFSLHGEELVADVADVADAMDVTDVTDPLSELTSDVEPSLGREQGPPTPTLPQSSGVDADVPDAEDDVADTGFLQRERGELSGVFSMSADNNNNKKSNKTTIPEEHSWM